MKHNIDSLLQFLDSSPTAWHAVAEACNHLQSAGFIPLNEEEPWTLAPGGCYYVTRNGSSLCAFVMPHDKIQSARVVGSHSDSPGFKLKPKAEFRKENMVMLGLELYGSPLITSWLNRDLGIAGRIITQDVQGRVQESLVRIDDHPLVIPQLAIHLDRQVNDNGLLLNKQEHLAALAAISDRPGPYLDHLLQEKVAYQQLLGSDLFLFPLEKAALLGFQKQLIASYRIDNLCSVHASLVALLHAKKAAPTELKMLVIWDNEEIGSESAQGAGSPFLQHLLERIALASNCSREEFFCLVRRSLCLSVDLAHALHPNYPERHEPRHQILMQRGIAIKSNAQHRYASDGRSIAAVTEICQKHKIPYQFFVTRGDIPCGSTIGPIHAANTGMPTVDIGTPQLSMHSCRELVACHDHLDMCRLLSAFLGPTSFS